MITRNSKQKGGGMPILNQKVDMEEEEVTFLRQVRSSQLTNPALYKDMDKGRRKMVDGGKKRKTLERGKRQRLGDEDDDVEIVAVIENANKPITTIDLTKERYPKVVGSKRNQPRKKKKLRKKRAISSASICSSTLSRMLYKDRKKNRRIRKVKIKIDQEDPKWTHYDIPWDDLFSYKVRKEWPTTESDSSSFRKKITENHKTVSSKARPSPKPQRSFDSKLFGLKKITKNHKTVSSKARLSPKPQWSFDSKLFGLMAKKSPPKRRMGLEDTEESDLSSECAASTARRITPPSPAETDQKDVEFADPFSSGPAASTAKTITSLSSAETTDQTDVGSIDPFSSSESETDQANMEFTDPFSSGFAASTAKTITPQSSAETTDQTDFSFSSCESEVLAAWNLTLPSAAEICLPGMDSTHRFSSSESESSVAWSITLPSPAEMNSFRPIPPQKLYKSCYDSMRLNMTAGIVPRSCIKHYGSRLKM